jgi:hypothetical protein
MPGPKNAGQSAGGFRFYTWQEEGQEPVKLLSVTSIKKLCGESWQLVNWQIGNVVNAACGMTQRVKIGPRGGRSKTYVLDGAFPGVFATKLLATEGGQAGLDKTREWLRQTAEEPRDTAAVRGTMVHEAIEIGTPLDSVNREYVEHAVMRLSARDQKKLSTRARNKGGETVIDEDIEFIQAALANYWDLRANVPFVVLAREPQVFNLTAGYGGSADALVWFLPEGLTAKALWDLGIVDQTVTDERVIAVLQRAADQGVITQAVIEAVGGHVCLFDWKTGSGPFTSQVVQVIAYLGCEFIGADSIRDTRLTEIVNAADEAAIVHVRPEGWEINFVDMRPDIVRGFLGSVAYARFLATFEEPTELFTHMLKGKANA